MEIEVTPDGAVMTITLNRPDTLNALDDAMHAGLADALSAAGDPSVRAVLVTGAGRGFCVGQDMAGLQPGADLGGRCCGSASTPTCWRCGRWRSR